MKRYFNIPLVLTLLLACFCFKSHAQTIQAEARLDRNSMPMGDQTILHVSAHLPANDTVGFPKLNDTIAGKVQVVNRLKPDTTFDKHKPGIKTITHNYTITSFDTGVYVIPSITLHTKTGDVETGTLTLQITSVKVDTTKTFYDIKQPFDVRYNFLDMLKDYWLWIVLTLVLIAAAIGLTIYLIKRPKKQIKVKKGPPLPYYVVALNMLNELRDKKLWQTDVKRYHSELSDIMRDYLEKRYKITTLEKTTAEIFTSLKNKSILQDSSNKLRRILELADLVKFAKEKPLPADNELSMEYAVNFIIQTKPETQLPGSNEDLKK